MGVALGFVGKYAGGVLEIIANAISDDMQAAHKGLTEFSSRVDKAERFDEEHLLPIALEVFGSVPFPVTTEYVPIKKSSRSKTTTHVRRLYFDSYYSFVMTDFFEGLHYGKYHRTEVSAVAEIYIDKSDSNMYQLKPAPPKWDLQEYMRKRFMPEHFADMKQAYIAGLLKALRNMPNSVKQWRYGTNTSVIILIKL